MEFIGVYFSDYGHVVMITINAESQYEASAKFRNYLYDLEDNGSRDLNDSVRVRPIDTIGKI